MITLGGQLVAAKYTRVANVIEETEMQTHLPIKK